MKFVIRCHECSEKLKLNDDLLGKKVQCRCGAVMRLPDSFDLPDSMKSASHSSATDVVPEVPPLEPPSRPVVRRPPGAPPPPNYSDPSLPSEFLHESHRRSKERRVNASRMDHSNWRENPASEVGFFGQSAGYGIGASVCIMIGAVYWFASESYVGLYTVFPPILFSIGTAGAIIGVLLFITSRIDRGRH